ncbi:MAG: glycosyltransferase [Muribaculaceae bacterium]|nr:glycosyltransferase [Muribaculaceae bacterium]MDE5968466.1 glycosyltransferase [Muribaculaceae bacterium]
MTPRFSIIIPVYNRPDEIEELLESLAAQSCKDFEVVITEDGSTVPCKDVVDRYADTLNITYLTQENEGRSPARNRSMANARGQWMVFFDSDCIIPPDYFKTLSAELDADPVDCFGGPDAAHPGFSRLQKAINFAMTSFLTTGGIRGGARRLENFTPRTFNMGFSREVYERVGGFKEMFSEDIDMSRRIMAAGYTPRLLRSIPVYHKRRGSLGKFFRQVHIFGRSRITLYQLYPDSLKLVHALPAVALIGFITLIALGIFCSPWWLLPIGIYAASLFISALVATRSVITALLAVAASAVQIIGYGSGFIRAFFNSIILRKGRNLNAEIKARKGK